jgi:outer membrane protein OmpA-like peptidoglycan-associated protein
MVRKLAVAVLLLFGAGSVWSQSWMDKLKSASDLLDNAAKEVTRSSKPAEGEAKKPAKDAAGGGQAGAAAGATSTDVPIGKAETIFSKYDFVPGDKVIFFDDFRDTDVGEFPRKWTLNGPKSGHNNAVEVVEYQGMRFLRSVPGTKEGGQHEATQYIRLTQKGDLPEKFTLEFDAVLGEEHGGGYVDHYFVYLLNETDHYPGAGGSRGAGLIRVSGHDGTSANTTTQISKLDNKVHHIAISVNGTFVKAYVDEQRVANDPDGVKRPIRLIGLTMASSGNVATDKLMFTNFRLAEGGKDIKSALDTEGKIVTHGILFDTGKATLKPESLPTLRTILGLLTGAPALKFSIEGHTDNQGDRSINQPLSESRAAAVKEWLAGKGIAADRLKTAGFGDSKPIDANSTAEGRANNRRVEFVKF